MTAPRRLVLVTGASSGIGAAFCRTYAAKGWDLALTARRADRLEALAAELAGKFGVEAMALPDDLADPGAPARLVQAVEARGRTIDGLVNNAGYGLRGAYEAIDWRAQQAFLQVLTLAPAELAHRVLPGMKARGFGRILNVASVLGVVPAIAGHGLYSAAKAFMVRFSEGLHLETLGTGVQVTALCPGLTRSEFHDAPEFRAEADRAPGFLWMDAEAVAAAGYAALERNQPVCIPGAANQAVVGLARAIPERWGLALSGRAGRR